MHAVMELNIISGAVWFFMATHSDLSLSFLSFNTIWAGSSLRDKVGYRELGDYGIRCCYVEPWD